MGMFDPCRALVGVVFHAGFVGKILGVGMVRAGDKRMGEKEGKGVLSQRMCDVTETEGRLQTASGTRTTLAVQGESETRE